MLSIEQKETISKALERQTHSLTCPMCKHNKFAMADGYFTNGLQDKIGSLNFGGVVIPTIAIICTNCGFVSQHALGSLGLLPKEDGTKQTPLAW